MVQDTGTREKTVKSMAQKALIPLHGNDVAPRLDLATEVLIAVGDETSKKWEEKIVVLSQSSSEQLCHLVLTEGVDAVICGGIEEEHYQYLTWKRVQVFDSVIGPWEAALERFYQGKLQSGDILYEDAE
jgi:predicted Fe-Mo cluster-binding NifX family protein